MLKRFLLLALFFCSLQAHAQPYKTIKPYKPYKWIFGVHWSGVEYDGSRLEGVFDSDRNRTALPYPTLLTIDRYFVYGWSMEASLGYNKFSSTRLSPDSNSVLFADQFSLDLNGKYSFYTKYAPRARWIEPYFVGGLGFTYRPSLEEAYIPTINLGAGINFWFGKYVGMRFAGGAKVAVFPEFATSPNNYLNASAGFVFRTPDIKPYKSSNKRRYKWIKKLPKRHREKGGH